MADIEQLRTKGWTYQNFELSEEEMATYAKYARELIELALENEDVKEALTPAGNTTSIGLSQSRTPGLDQRKETLQLGADSEAYAQRRIFGPYQPAEMRRFWPIHSLVLREVRASAEASLRELGATNAAMSLLKDKKQNVLIRTNWFRGATEISDGDAPKEILSGHADRGVVTLHLFETHGGYLRGAAYDRETAFTDAPELRRQRVSRMLGELVLVEPQDHASVMFLGAGWWNLDDKLVETKFQDLPALYHVGTKPKPQDMTESPYSDMVTNGQPDRLSVVAFVDPPEQLINSGRYAAATREIARPTLG